MGNVVFAVCFHEEVEEIFTRRCKAEDYIYRQTIPNHYSIDVYELDPTE
jgi:hypothetical protein